MQPQQTQDIKHHYIQTLEEENKKLKEKVAQLENRNKELECQCEKLKGLARESEEKVQIEGLQLSNIMEDLSNKPTSPRFHYEKRERQSQIMRKYQEEVEEIDLKEKMHSTKESPNEQKDSVSQEDNEFQSSIQDLRRSHRASSISEKPLPVIEGCFIIEKKNFLEKTNNLSNMIQFIYPNQLEKNQKQMLELLIKYTFINPELTKTEDDEFHSRRNEITYGTPYEDLTYAFEDNKWNAKKEIPEILQMMGTLKKKYVHILLRPEIIEIEDEGKKEQMEQTEKKQRKSQEIVDEYETPDEMNTFYETEVIYGFISSFPLRGFFQDLHRVIQQQIKYNQFQTGQEEEMTKQISRTEKYKIIGKAMINLMDQGYTVSRFPFKHTYFTGTNKIELNIPSLQAYNQNENQFLKYAIGKYPVVSICRLIHYVLSERFLIIEAKNRKMLNQMFEIIRVIIKPFIWIFANVYVYSEYFQPFLQSPMPLVIGKVESAEQLDCSSQFITLNLDGKNGDLKEKQIYYKSIKRLKKHWEKADDKIQLLRKYVNNLKNFINKGILDQEPTDFHIDLIETQLVSYYKDLNP